MRTSILLVLLAVATAAPCEALLAQFAVPVAIGQRVRVSTSIPVAKGRDRYVGHVVALRIDSLTVQVETSPATRAVALADIKKLEVRALAGNAWRGAGIGLVVGAVSGAIYSKLTHQEGRGECGFFWCDADYVPEQGGRMGESLFSFGLLGMGVGALGGHFVRTERWVSRRLGHAPARRTPAPDAPPQSAR
jgi:hypothetical protein